MDTAYETPFVLEIITEYDTPVVQNLTLFVKSEEELLTSNFITAVIEENDNISIRFISDDPYARLYLEALEGIPDDYETEYDEFGDIFCKPNENPIPLYKQGNEFDAFRVDTFKIRVYCKEQNYYGWLDIRPKQLTRDDWRIMKEDLEQEITGLAQDLVRRNIGLGYEHPGNLPPEQLLKFLTIRRHSRSVIAALMDIKNKPRYSIIKCYEPENIYKAVEMDAETIKRRLKQPQNQSNVYVPVKHITYDLQENRLLKHMLWVYERELRQFITLIQGMKDYFYQNADKRNYSNSQYDKVYIMGLEQYQNSAEKLIKITQIVKNQFWFKEITDSKDSSVTHAFAMDSRYGAIYKLYKDLTSDKFQITLDPKYSYSWKKSSELYEMWCYIKVCRAFAVHYSISSNWLDSLLNSSLLFPFLKKDTCITFENESIQIDIIYDRILPQNYSGCNPSSQPFYMLGNHRRPDITINLFYKAKEMYIGSIILECKYRKIVNFLYGRTLSSREQILGYYEESRSKHYYNSISDDFDIRPVEKVIVLTPDLVTNERKVRRIKEDKVVIKSLIPNHESMISELYFMLNDLIAQRLEVAHRTNP